MALTRDEILAHRDLGLEEVEVPELGGTVFIRRTGSGDRDRFLTWATADGDDLVDMKPRYLVRCICDAEGKRLFGDDEYPLLSELSAIVVDKLFRVARRVNAIDQDDVEAIKGNSEPAPADASSSTSPSSSVG